MSDHSPVELGGALKDALRPLVAELVAEEVERRLATQARPAEEEPEYLTVAQYAERHQATPAAVRARIRRGHLPDAFKPPGSDEWLIPNGEPTETQAQLTPTTKSPRDATTSGGVTPKE